MIITLQTLVFFRESLLTALDRFVRPYYKHLVLGFFNRKGDDLEVDDVDDEVFSEFDEEKGVVFYPPMYAQRYAAVSDCLLDPRWCGLIDKVVDFGHHDMSFIQYLKDVPGIRCILGVDIETIPLRCSSDLLGRDEHSTKRESPLQVTLFQGNAADPDYRLIGCDAVIAIEMIEHMLPHDLERFVHTVFGFIKPRIVVFTTPNADFNVLFKALEKNGLRRWDHLFEWSREQFNDWCSNIVSRYPNYTVSCKGIGPGPPGTLHHGCCSQLALFTAKEYIKQPDLNLNCLASQLVGTLPTHNNFSEVFDSWISSPSPSPQPPECNVKQQSDFESLTEILYPREQSHMTLILSSTLCNSVPLTERTFTMETYSYRDQTLQCNLDVEVGKSFMMFDEEYYHVLSPRRRVCNRVYEIEDVYSRLNCTTLQVKRFSKTTQNLMARNRIDSVVHTREVVDEIRQLTKALNFNNDNKEAGDAGHIWCNINWGDNAPYWNQYYKIVREYAYPLETKSEEVRILELVAEEISRLVDTEVDEEFTLDMNHIEIPLEHLMKVLQHITDDVDRVRDLLEWNGYEIINDMVIHTRMVVDNNSVATRSDEWQDNEFSDWDTDPHTPSMSEHSTIVPDLNGRPLRRALDKKVRNLRTMLKADEDITTELDRVVCRLMKLALHSSVGRKTAPPSRWMQCKLLDLLTLTEKAIKRRKICSIENIPLKAIEYKKYPKEEPEQDSRVKEIVAKYRYLLQPLEKITNTDDGNNSPVTDVGIEDEFLSTTSLDFPRENEYTVGMSPSLVIPRPVFSTEAFKAPESTPDANPLERTKAWLAEDVEVEPYPNHEVNYDNISSGDTDTSANNAKHKHKKSKKHKTKSIREPVAECKTSSSKTSYKIKRDYKKNSKTRIIKNVAKKKSNFYINKVANPDGGYSSPDYENYADLRSDKQHEVFSMKKSKPIPESLIRLCHSECHKGESDIGPKTDQADDTGFAISSVPSPISATEESFRVDIVTQEFEETIALRRTIATDTEIASNEIAAEMKTKDNFEVLGDFDQNLCTKHEVSTENVQSQTFFLNDINEPSTSKGIRHNVSTDVQCGPDTLAAYSLSPASTSLSKMSQGFSTHIKMNTGPVDHVKGTDFGTSTEDTAIFKTITPRRRPIGIKIKDSDVNIRSHSESSTMTLTEIPQTFATSIPVPPGHSTPVHSAVSVNGTKLIMPVLSFLKIVDSGSEFCAPSVASTSKTYYSSESKHTSNVLMESYVHNEILSRQESPSKLNKLSCGAVHIHSYRDQQLSEDVVYQGEWQQYKPKQQRPRKKANTVSALRKSNEVAARKSKETVKEKKVNLKEKKVNLKEKVLRKRQEKKQIEAEPKEPTQLENEQLKELSKEDNNNEIKKTRISKSVIKITDKTIKQRIPRPLKASAKMASKLAISAITSKNVKSSFTVKKPAILAKKDDIPQKHRKSYIPLYLKRTLLSKVDKDKLNKSLDSATEPMTGNKDKLNKGFDSASEATTDNNDKLNKSLDSASKAASENKNKLANEITSLVRSKTEEIKNDLLKLSDDLHVNTNYVVCCNELEDNIKSDEQTSVNSKDRIIDAPKQLDSLKRSISPTYSMNSSTCSTPNSVATVRPASTRAKSAKRHSTSSHKSSVTITNSESDNPTPTRTKKIVKRYKLAKKIENKDIGNKENIPESTKNFVHKDKGKMCKFLGKPKTICRAQIDTESSSSPLARQKAQVTNKSVVKISSQKNSDERRTAISPSVSKKRSLKSDTSSVYDDLIQNDSGSQNMVLVLEPQHNYEDLSKTRNITESETANSTLSETTNSTLVPDSIKKSSVHNIGSGILNSMRELLEETLDQIVVPHEIMFNGSSHTVTLGDDDRKKTIVDRVTTPEIETDDSFVGISPDDENNPLKRTFDNVLGDESIISLNDTMVNKLEISDLDLLSFKSITSGSKFSDYYLADNEFNNSQEIDQVPTENSTSVHGIFERKETHLIQSTPGALAIQAFSGFSLDAEPVAGDQLDSIALNDSEGGSLTVEISRQATSEEVFISGRSSDSYQSCVLDDDTVVPNWLFQVISQQHSVEDYREPALIGPMPAPLDDPMFDANGNIVEPSLLGVGAGAGDGRGMHSDHSQDSSGRGTSLSSSDTSSGPQSEVSTIMIEPSTQFELLRDPMTSSAVMPLGRDHSDDRTYGIDDEVATLATSHDIRTRTVNRASDIDADESSLDTDVPDLSDY